MKLLLMTFHNAANYGAALQTFALQFFLKNIGYDSVYIDYENKQRSDAYNMPYLAFQSFKKGQFKNFAKYLLGMPFLEIRKIKFKHFLHKYVVITPKRYCSSEEARALNTEFDVFIIGSDQVWNPSNNGSDFAYLLNFVEDKKVKISYSSSFGMMEVPKNLYDDYVSCLSRFDYLGVREKIGVDLIKHIVGRDATLVLDPVFLLNINDWNLLLGEKAINEKYVFTYTNSPNQVNDFLYKTKYSFKGKKHYKLSRNTSVQDFFNPNVRVKYCMSPVDFLRTIKYAELIVTASFHCLALSIIMHKQFVVILTGNEGRDQRLLHLLECLGLQNRILTSDLTIDQINERINYVSVESSLDKLRSQSINYLIRSINNPNRN